MSLADTAKLHRDMHANAVRTAFKIFPDLREEFMHACVPGTRVPGTGAPKLVAELYDESGLKVARFESVGMSMGSKEVFMTDYIAPVGACLWASYEQKDWTPQQAKEAIEAHRREQ